MRLSFPGATLVAALLAGCGGGGGDAAAPAAPEPARRAALATLPAGDEGVVDTAALFGFAEAALAGVFSGQPQAGELGPYQYRFYPGSGNYLGFNGYEIYLLGPHSGGAIAKVGTMQDYACVVYPADCASRVVRPHLAAQHPSYGPSVVTSGIDTPMVVPTATTRSAGKSIFFRYGFARSFAAGDVTGDGLDDIVVAPTFFDQPPQLPVEIWVNKGDGSFENRTAQLFDGAVPTTGASAGILLADYNNDGRLDIFITDQGGEYEDCGLGLCAGSTSVLVLSQPGGKFKDVSATHLAGNQQRFHHVVTGVGDIDGDGDVDIAVPVFPTSATAASGVLLWMNDGSGNFSERSSELLTDEVGFRPSSYVYSDTRPAAYDRQEAGNTAIADLDGDGRAELLTCSYTRADRHSGKRSVRIHAWDPAQGRLVETGRFFMPDALAAISGGGSGPVTGAGNIGCAGLSAGDIDGDGLTDIVVSWESFNDQYVHVARNLGNGQFVDTTLAAFGAYKSTIVVDGFHRPNHGSLLRDVNGDGRPDITHRISGIGQRHVAAGSPATSINDGSGRFAPQRLRTGGAYVSQSQLSAMLGGKSWHVYVPLYGRFFPGPRAGLDLLLVNSSEQLHTGFFQESRVGLRALQVD